MGGREARALDSEITNLAGHSRSSPRSFSAELADLTIPRRDGIGQLPHF